MSAGVYPLRVRTCPICNRPFQKGRSIFIQMWTKYGGKSDNGILLEGVGITVMYHQKCYDERAKP